MTSESDLAADEARLQAIADELVEGIETHLGPWLRNLVANRSAGRVAGDDASAVLDLVAATVVERVRQLLTTDIDDQRANPLALIRSGLGPVTELLAAAEAPLVDRDPFDQQAFPDDVFALAPARFDDIHESLQEPGIRWGAAKAHVHLARRRAEGLI